MDVTITNAGGRIEIIDLRNDLTNNYDVLKDGLRLFNLGDIVRITFINRRNIEINYNEVELINGATSILPVSGVDFLNELNILLGDFGAGGGATQLEDLTDVEITSVANGEVLIYDSASGKWINTSAPGGGDMFKSVYDTDNDGVVDKAETVQIIVRNSTGSTLTKGQIVYLSGATGNRPNAVLAQSNSVNSKKSIGWVTENIANNSDGFVAVSGSAHDLDTSAFSAGDLLYLSSTVAGGLTNIIPAHPNYEIFIGFCARAHPNFGRIIFKIQEVLEIESLHDVSITSVANNDGLFYESSSQLWKNKTIETVLGAASSSQNGYLSSSDWITFNNKAFNYRSTTDGVPTSTASITLSHSILIPGGTFAAGNIIRIHNRMRATGIGAAKTQRIYVNSTNDLTGALLIATNLSGSNVTIQGMKRDLVIKSATVTEVFASTVAIATDDSSSNTSTNLNIDWTINKYIIFTNQRGSAGDVLVSSSYLIERL